MPTSQKTSDEWIVMVENPYICFLSDEELLNLHTQSIENTIFVKEYALNHIFKLRGHLCDITDKKDCIIPKLTTSLYGCEK